jgi:hypothetical protein
MISIALLAILSGLLVVRPPLPPQVKTINTVEVNAVTEDVLVVFTTTATQTVTRTPFSSLQPVESISLLETWVGGCELKFTVQNTGTLPVIITTTFAGDLTLAGTGRAVRIPLAVGEVYTISTPFGTCTPGRCVLQLITSTGHSFTFHLTLTSSC